MWSRRMQFAIHQGRVVFWNRPGWEDRGGGEGRATPSGRQRWPASLSRLLRGRGRIPRLPPALFLPLRGLNLGRCLWKALPKVSQNTLGFFFSAQLRLSRTHTPFWAQRGVVLRLGVRRAPSQLPCAPGSLLWFLALETQSPHPVSLQTEKTQSLPLTSSRGRRLAGRPAAPRFSTFSLRPAWAGAKTRKGGSGKGGITLRAPRPSDP